MAASSSKRLPLALYRATLRWARANADVPFTLRSSDVFALAPALRQQGGALAPAPALLDSGARALPPVARAAYEACRGAQGVEREVRGVARGARAAGGCAAGDRQGSCTPAPVLLPALCCRQARAPTPPLLSTVFTPHARTCRHLEQDALDRGLEAVRLLHTGYAAQLAEMRETRADRADRGGVRFSVGDVVLHKKVGRLCFFFIKE